MNTKKNTVQHKFHVFKQEMRYFITEEGTHVQLRFIRCSGEIYLVAEEEKQSITTLSLTLFVYRYSFKGFHNVQLCEELSLRPLS